jgi:hypothetical protein
MRSRWAAQGILSRETLVPQTGERTQRSGLVLVQILRNYPIKVFICLLRFTCHCTVVRRARAHVMESAQNLSAYSFAMHNFWNNASCPVPFGHGEVELDSSRESARRSIAGTVVLFRRTTQKVEI